MNIAMISKWHVHAPDYAYRLKSIEGCHITVVWDEDKQRGLEWAKELNAVFMENYDELLASPLVDAVVINAPTNMHKDLIIKAANARKHIFTEKVLTLTEADALEVRDKILQNGVIFTISFPHKCKGNVRKAKELAENGEIGEVTYARVRNVHNGRVENWLPQHFYDKAQCGGGAMIDLGAHPMYLLQWILGKELSVSSVFTNFLESRVEDNAVSVISFEKGKIGVAETGFVSSYNPFVLEISGTKGMIIAQNEDTLRCVSTNTSGKWMDIGFDENLPLPVYQWADSVLHHGSSPVEFDIEQAVALSRIMEAAYK